MSKKSNHVRKAAEAEEVASITPPQLLSNPEGKMSVLFGLKLFMQISEAAHRKKTKPSSLVRQIVNDCLHRYVAAAGPNTARTANQLVIEDEDLIVLIDQAARGLGVSPEVVLVQIVEAGVGEALRLARSRQERLKDMRNILSQDCNDCDGKPTAKAGS